ncbi:right-handed parallel beta-helix repeat-containing protein [Kibdelosporangium persicum]|nr:right-handed parallel beta-helix repeat-containing protein [Kibdelosporangium persicum]
MADSGVNRRTLLGGTAIGLAGMAGAAGVASAEPAGAQATAMGPWTYVPPGESIKAALDTGARAVQLGDGDYRISEPLVLPSGATIRGLGRRTRLLATTTMTTVIAIGNGGPVESVHVADLLIECDGKASTGIDLNVVGTTGNYYWEPDSICRLDNLRIYQPVLDGVQYRGEDTQSCVSSRIRVRDAGRYGYHIQAPDNWWIACEATTSKQTGSSAGFGVFGANNFFQSCKAWYCRDYGFHVRGVRNKFIGCEAQDTRSHGWYIEWGRNVYTGCSADSASFYDVGGTAAAADGFYVVDGGDTSMVGCQAFDRKADGHAPQQRYGFNVPASMITNGQLVGHSGYDNVSGLVNRR